MKRKQWPDRPGLFTRDKNWKITWLNAKCYMTLTDLQERKFAHIVTKWQCNVKHMKWCHFWLWIKGWSHCLWNVCLSSLNRRGPVLGTPDVTLGLSAIVNRRTSRGSKWVCLIGRSREVYIRCWGQSTHSCCWGQGTDTSQNSAFVICWLKLDHNSNIEFPYICWICLHCIWWFSVWRMACKNDWASCGLAPCKR